MLTTAYNAFTFLSNVEKCDYLIMSYNIWLLCGFSRATIHLAKLWGQDLQHNISI